MLIAKNIKKKYGNVDVLNGVNLEIKKGELVALMGSSGAGKTTLLHILGLIDKLNSGEVILNNQRIDNLKSIQRADIRNEKIGFIFQFHHLLPEFSVLENICMPAWIGKKNKSYINERSTLLLQKLHIEHKANALPKALSGGEQQRVAIARALMNTPDIILADEPTGNLDSANTQNIIELFKTLNQQYQQTFLIVTHNPQLAAQCDRTIYIKDGIVIDL